MPASDEWNAQVGDEVSIESHKLRGARRTGVIVELLGSSEHPYYRVRWHDGRETVFHPGSDARLHPKDGRPRAARKAAPAAASRSKPARVAAAPPRRQGLRARAGDRLLIRGHRLGEPTRDAEILEVLGADGRPPFRVRWSDSGREAVYFPGPDATVEHFPDRKRRPDRIQRRRFT
jgi:hypothetical protein